MNEPYPHISDRDLDRMILEWEFGLDLDAGMIVTDLGAWESEEYERWCQERESREEAA